MGSSVPELVTSPVAHRGNGHKGLAPLIRKMKLENPSLSNTAIARHCKCSTANVKKVLAKLSTNYSTEDLEEYKANRADIFAALGRKMLGSITESKLQKTSAVQLVTGAAILFDKERLERGQATGINVTALVDVAELLRNQQ